MSSTVEIVDAAIAQFQKDDWTAPTVAAKARAYLDEKHPGVLAEWLMDRAELTLVRYIGDEARNDRLRSQAQMRRGAFGDAAERYVAGEGSAFDEYFVVGDERYRRRVGDMTGADWRDVAKRYSERKRVNGLMEQFALAVARKVGKQRTQDVLSEEQYENLYLKFFA